MLKGRSWQEKVVPSICSFKSEYVYVYIYIHMYVCMYLSIYQSTYLSIYGWQVICAHKSGSSAHTEPAHLRTHIRFICAHISGSSAHTLSQATMVSILLFYLNSPPCVPPNHGLHSTSLFKPPPLRSTKPLYPFYFVI